MCIKKGFQLPDEETFQRFQERCGYDEVKEPYAGRDRRDTALRELEQKYKTDEPVFGICPFRAPFLAR